MVLNLLNFGDSSMDKSEKEYNIVRLPEIFTRERRKNTWFKRDNVI